MARIRKNSTVSKANTGKSKIWYIALYIRLSKDDGNDVSLNVTNQCSSTKKIPVGHL